MHHARAVKTAAYSVTKAFILKMDHAGLAMKTVFLVTLQFVLNVHQDTMCFKINVFLVKVIAWNALLLLFALIVVLVTG